MVNLIHAAEGGVDPGVDPSIFLDQTLPPPPAIKS
jgi:hypothetical protein